MTDGSGGITPIGGLGMLWYPVKHTRTSGSSSSSARAARTAALQRRRVPALPGPAGPARAAARRVLQGGQRGDDEAWVAIYCGHEFQLFDGNEPNSEPQKTGSVYNFQTTTTSRRSADPKDKGEWEDYEVEVLGQTYEIYRNGVRDQQVRQLAGQGVQPRR